MEPVSSRGSQSPSTMVESEVSPSVVPPRVGARETGAKTLPSATPVTANKLQSYVATAGEPQETMCRMPSPPFSRSEPQGEELKLLEQFRARQATASLGRGVELCKDHVDVPVVRYTPMKHHWLRTSLAEAGMGPVDGSFPGEGRELKTPAYGPTRLNDHTGRGDKPDATCERVKDVDEACVNRELVQLGKPLGDWTPLNNCQTYAAGVLENCSTKPIPVPTPPLVDPEKI